MHIINNNKSIIIINNNKEISLRAVTCSSSRQRRCMRSYSPPSASTVGHATSAPGAGANCAKRRPRGGKLRGLGQLRGLAARRSSSEAASRALRRRPRSLFSTATLSPRPTTPRSSRKPFFSLRSSALSAHAISSLSIKSIKSIKSINVSLNQIYKINKSNK